MDTKTKIFPDLFSLGNEMNMRWNETWKGFTQHHRGLSPEPGLDSPPPSSESWAAETQHDGRADGFGMRTKQESNSSFTGWVLLMGTFFVLSSITVWAFPGNQYLMWELSGNLCWDSWMQKHSGTSSALSPAWKEVSECHHQPNYRASPLSDARLTERLFIISPDTAMRCTLSHP